jgi:nucleotide-binding universal stress UspA family protein
MRRRRARLPIAARSLGWPYFEQALNRARRRAEQAIADLVEHDRVLPECDYVVDIVGGSPVDALERVAIVRRARAIVVTKRWKGWPGTALGSMSRSLARRTSIPIISVPADWSWVPPTDPAGQRDAVGRAGRLPDPSLWW